MKTRGLEVYSGYLVPAPLSDGRPNASGGSVPVQFWNRLKAAIDRAGLRDEYLAEYEAQRAIVEASPRSWCREADLEHALFRSWTLRVVGEQERWPWERGWSEADVDGYLAKEGT
jgi:hypothetical protein